MLKLKSKFTKSDDNILEQKTLINKKITPLPKKIIFTVWIIQFSESFQSGVLLPFAPFMVASFSEIPEEQLGIFAGLLAASFALGQLISSYPWGYLSDRFGEKLIVLISMSVTIVLTIFFGLSTSYTMAFLIRFFSGIFNGNIGVIKTYLGKNTDSSNQTRAMSLISSAWIIGSIVGPVFGGILAEPTVNYPDFFDSNGFFGTYAYFLPCALTALIVLVSLIISLVWMHDDKFRAKICEIKDFVWRKNHQVHKLERKDSSIIYLKLREDEYQKNDPMFTNSKPSEVDTRSNLSEEESKKYIVSNTTLSSKWTYGTLDDQNETHTSNVFNELPQNNLPVANDFKFGSVMFRQMFFSCSMYALVGFLFISIDETFPLFARADPEKGGLGFSSSQLGYVLCSMGVIETIYVFVFYPFVIRNFSNMLILRISLVLFLIVFALLPLANYFALDENPVLVWIILLIALGMRGIFSTNIYTPVMIYINNSVPKDCMGRANGYGQAMVALTRAIGPALSGLIWTITTENATFYLHSASIFIIFLPLQSALIFLLSWFYPENIDLAFEDR
jgi:MFS family permease